MGLKVSAIDAARLTNRGERTIRRWIAQGTLMATPEGAREAGQGVGPSRWLVDVDDLRRIRGVVINDALLTQLEARSALAGSAQSLVQRVDELERAVENLQARLNRLETRQAPGS